MKRNHIFVFEMKRVFIDQMNRSVEVVWPPQRIVSLVPSQTELLYDFGLQNEVVGQTLFCIHPAQMHNSKPRVGGTKNFNLDKIAALNPDLIIGNKEENEQAGIEELSKLYPVWMSDIQTLNDSLEMIRQIGALVNREIEAQFIASKIQQSFNSISEINHPKSEILYLIWRKPWMAAGHDTFINDMLNRLGFNNVVQPFESRYPEITTEQLQQLQPEIIFLSSEPYPFKDKHIEELKAVCPEATIMLVDGELFSWYGSRLLHSAAYFKTLLSTLAK
jgi:ABC-type Fe3+-hydroxamate transport system substrate-binding protein